MYAIKNSNEEQIALLFDKFLEEYSSLYNEDALAYIKENFWEYVYESDGPDILMQIYNELGIYSRKGNFYTEHIKRITKLFGIDKQLLEIGSGYIPSLSNRIAKEQLHIKKGNITLYEPLLLRVDSKYPNMTLHKEKFTTDVDVKDFDLLFGILACDATEVILESACKNHKDFYIALCGCAPIDSYYPYSYVSPDMYHQNTISYAKELVEKYNNGILEIDRLPKHFGANYPIIYNRR